jgi:hypothetical protein
VGQLAQVFLFVGQCEVTNRSVLLFVAAFGSPLERRSEPGVPPD